MAGGSPARPKHAFWCRYFIYLSWLPTYFLEVHGLNLRNSSALAFIPWLVMALGSSLSGILADRWLAQGASVATVRKTFQSIAFAVMPTHCLSASLAVQASAGSAQACASSAAWWMYIIDRARIKLEDVSSVMEVWGSGPFA